MYLLLRFESSQKIKIISAVLSAVFMIASIWMYSRVMGPVHSSELASIPYYSIIAIILFFVSIIFLCICIAINAIQKDIRACLKYLDENKESTGN